MEKYTPVFWILGMIPWFAGTATAAQPTVGDPAPEISAKDQNGKEILISALKGSWVLLYFYPKDDTPGCTKEACSIRDGFTQFKKSGIHVFGVSTQSAESHQKFREKYKLPFDLLVDESGAVGKALGIEKIPLIGLYKRQTVLIDPAGKVSKRMNDVDPATHADEILKHVESHSKN